MLLPHVAAFNREFVAGAVVAEVDALAPLYAEIGFEPRFAPGEVGPDGVEAMVAAAIEQPVPPQQPPRGRRG